MSVFSATLPEQMIDASLQVSLGNDLDMKAFYVPELTLNALRVSEPDGDPSAVVSQLMKAATRAQTVCGIGVGGGPFLHVVRPQFSQSLWEWCLERQRMR